MTKMLVSIHLDDEEPLGIDNAIVYVHDGQTRGTLPLGDVATINGTADALRLLGAQVNALAERVVLAERQRKSREQYENDPAMRQREVMYDRIGDALD